MTKIRPIEDRFFEKVNKTDECWLWTASCNRFGYGKLHSITDGKTRMIPAHRFSWRYHFGEIPKGLWVLHKCDVPGCVNPGHLFLGTRLDNMRDCASKGRINTIGKSNLTHCKRGHQFSEENTIRNALGHRQCIACKLMYQENRNMKRREEWARRKI